MGATTSQSVSKESRGQNKRLFSYDQFCRYELMKQDLMELARFFMKPYNVALSDLESTVSKFLPKDPSTFENQNNLGSLTFGTVMGTEAGSLAGKKDYPVGPDGKRLKPCCACPETKRARDACIIENGEEHCTDLIEAHKACMRSLGFNI